MRFQFIASTIENVMIAKGNKALKDMDESSKDALEANRKLLMKIVNDNKDTEFGKKHNFKDIKTIDDYKKNVPFTDYDTYAPYIERMINNNETNLITAYPLVQYAETSGSVGVQKKIPITQPALDIYTKYTISRAVALANEYYKKKNDKLIRGMGLNTLESNWEYLSNGTILGSISGSVARQYKHLFPLFLSSPTPVLFPEKRMNLQYMKARFALECEDITFIISAFMTNIYDIMNYIKLNWEMIVDDIEHGTINEDVCSKEAYEELKKYVKPNPKRANELRKIFNEGFDEPIIPKLWPKLGFLSAIGTGGFASYTEKFRKYLGDIPIDFFVYAASEGLFAACRDVETPEFVLLTDSCFYEFIPIDAEDETKTLNINELEVGKDYEIVITNLSGFYRYRIKDVVRVLGYYNSMPLIAFAYRKNQMVSTTGEKTTEEHLDEVIKRFQKSYDCTIADYAIYVDDNNVPTRYVFILEPDDDKLDVKKLDEYSKTMDKHLCDVNALYDFVRKNGSIAMPLIFIGQKQTHSLWREYKMYKGSSSNQVKPVRVLDVPVKQNFFFGLLEEGQTVDIPGLKLGTVPETK